VTAQESGTACCIDFDVVIWRLVVINKNIEIPFNTSIENFGIQRFDDQNRPTHREACIYLSLLLELRIIQFVIHAIGGLDGRTYEGGIGVYA